MARGKRLTCVMLSALALAACANGPVDGGDVARDSAEAQAKRLADKLGRPDRPRDAQYIAATQVPAGAPGDETTTVTTLAWSGRVYSDDTATIDVRFAVTVPAREPAMYGERGHTAGSSTRCYRYTLQLYRDTGYREITCPALASPPVPSASPPLSLPRDAQDRLAAALQKATPDTLAATVRAAFPQPGIKVDTVTHDGTLVAAVGVPAERDCVVAIRTADGQVEPVGFDRIQLEPGELGCSVGLYLNPPR